MLDVTTYNSITEFVLCSCLIKIFIAYYLSFHIPIYFRVLLAYLDPQFHPRT